MQSHHSQDYPLGLPLDDHQFLDLFSVFFKNTAAAFGVGLTEIDPNELIFGAHLALFKRTFDVAVGGL